MSVNFVNHKVNEIISIDHMTRIALTDWSTYLNNVNKMSVPIRVCHLRHCFHHTEKTDHELNKGTQPVFSVPQWVKHMYIVKVFSGDRIST